MTWRPSCAVSGCLDRVSPRHRFPKPDKYPNLFEEWVKLCNNNRLKQKPPTQVYQNSSICRRHFDKEDLMNHNRLKRGLPIVPHKNMPSLDTANDPAPDSTPSTHEANSPSPSTRIDVFEAEPEPSTSRPKTPPRTPSPLNEEEGEFLKSIRLILGEVPLIYGNDYSLMEDLIDNVSRVSSIDRTCILLFDEVSLKLPLEINSDDKDINVSVDTDTGFEKSLTIADHALLFMARGLNRQWTQPLQFTFTCGSTPGEDIAAHIKTVINACQEAGLNVVATVSNQGPANEKAVDLLAQSTAGDCRIFCINGKPIVHLYDPPHLLKGIRDNLLTKDLVWHKNDEELIADWQSVIYVYNEDRRDKKLRCLPRLTENHIQPDSKEKQTVAYAAQVLSHSVAAFMDLMASVMDDPNLRDSLRGTAKIFKFFDTLFDSVNGVVTTKIIRHKPLKRAATMKSPHDAFWEDAIRQLKCMSYLREGVPETVPTLKNWVITLTGLRILLKSMRRWRLDFLITKRCNQDPLEDFFGLIPEMFGIRETVDAANN